MGSAGLELEVIGGLTSRQRVRLAGIGWATPLPPLRALALVLGLVLGMQLEY